VPCRTSIVCKSTSQRTFINVCLWTLRYLPILGNFREELQPGSRWKVMRNSHPHVSEMTKSYSVGEVGYRCFHVQVWIAGHNAAACGRVEIDDVV
jgi:hypothetical protein